MRKARPWYWFGWLVLLLYCNSPAIAFDGQLLKVPAGPVTIEAGSISYDQAKDIFSAESEVTIAFPGGELRANAVQLEKGGRIATATGQVRIRMGSDILEGDRVVFDLVENTGVVYAGKMFASQNHFYLQGAKIIKKEGAVYQVDDFSLTTCDGTDPDWRIAGRQMDVTVDGYGTIKGGKFIASDVPLLYLPYFLFPAKTSRQSGFLFPRIAYSRDKLAWDIQLPFFLAISRSTDATFYQRYMEKKGFQEGVEYRYFLDDGSYGTVFGEFLHDNARITEQTGDLVRDWQSPRNRWSFYLQTYTPLKPDLYLRTDITRVSDIWYFRDFASRNYYQEHYALNADDRFKKVYFTAAESLATLESKVRLVKNWSLYNLTTLIKYTDNLAANSNDTTIQKYPEVTLTGIDQAFFDTPFRFGLGAVYSGNYRREGQTGHVADISPNISLPLEVGNYFHLTPEIGLYGTFWDRRHDAANSDRYGSRTTYRLSLDATTAVFRDYALSGTRVEKIRHEMKPELIYTYVPQKDQSDLPAFAQVLEKQNTLAAAFTNSLIAKIRDEAGRVSYQEILRFKLLQSYDIEEARTDGAGSTGSSKAFSDLDMELDFKPSSSIAFFARNRFSVNSGRWEKVTYELQLTDKRGNSTTIGYRYTRDVLEEIDLFIKLYLTKRLDVSYEIKRNQFDEHTLNNSFSFNYQRQCWSIGLSYAEIAGDTTVMLNFSLAGLGHVGER